MPTPSKIWNQNDRVAFVNAYTNLRRHGCGRLESRMSAQDVLSQEKRYSQSSVNKLAVNAVVRDIMSQAEAFFLSGGQPAQFVPTPVTMDQPKVSHPEDDVGEDATPETHLILLLRSMREENIRTIDKKLVRILDLLTTPGVTREQVEGEILESLSKKDKRRKLVVIGLKGVQPSVVEAAIGKKFKTKYVRSEHATAQGTKESVKNADVVVTMKEFIGHDTEDIVTRYLHEGASWFSHPGGIKLLIDKLNAVV